MDRVSLATPVGDNPRTAPNSGVLFNQPVPSPSPASTFYRLAPSLVARLTGAALVVAAVAVLVVTVVAALAHTAFWPVVLVAAVSLVGVGGLAWWASRRAYVVRLDEVGYEVRLLRGAGVRRARWADVAAISTAERSGVACVVVALRDGRTTALPMAALAGDRDQFVTNLRNLLPKPR
jgi:alpha-beta hydrolase superfamily lysophospholipase